MVQILLACSAGMSTSLLQLKMEKYIKEEKLDYKVTALDSSSAKSNIKKYDIVMLGPQVRFMLNEFKSLGAHIPIEVIPMALYGTMNGTEVVKIVKDIFH